MRHSPPAFNTVRRYFLERDIQLVHTLTSRWTSSRECRRGCRACFERFPRPGEWRMHVRVLLTA